MEERAHVTDWDEKLRVYLQEIKQQKDAATTYKNEKAYLTPWVKWIKKNGGRASNQRLKAYLKERNYMKTSYKRVGMAIQNFCNDTADYKWEMIKCPKVHGHEKEKPTLAMPAGMLDAL